MTTTTHSATTEASPIQPTDDHDVALVQHVRPPGWENPTPAGRYHMVVIGAGTAGLVTAAGAAGLGAKVALVERNLMGGDCLNVGCVPSKALIRSSRAFAAVRDAHRFGVRVPQGASVDFAQVIERMRKLRAQLSEHDAASRFRDLGVDVFFGAARFAGPDSITVDNQVLTFKRACVATGARPVIPPIDGIEHVPYYTNETLFTLTQLPGRLAVVGGGPIGVEMAQAFARFGSDVSLIEASSRILSREDPDTAEIIADALQRDGVHLHSNCRVTRAKSVDSAARLYLTEDDESRMLEVDAVLLSVGRAANVENLHLDKAGVDCDDNGVIVDVRLRTTNRRIYAAGDVCLPFLFTHTADAAARIVIQNALFLGRKRLNHLTVPWCTYTDPEIAHVGLYEKEAREQGYKVRTLSISLSDVDRAVLNGDTHGTLKVLLKDGSDTILGATLVAPQAGEMISEMTLAITSGLGLRDIGDTIHTYPTESEIFKKAADAYNRTRLTPFRQRLLSALLRIVR